MVQGAQRDNFAAFGRPGEREHVNDPDLQRAALLIGKVVALIDADDAAERA